ncbi:MAG TPA: GNAT family N-acetyltransferase [Nocardioidaceae bacterium]|nr:GNAT family N-acetyltransferase [Nocardioidaceae bacterium]
MGDSETAPWGFRTDQDWRSLSRDAGPTATPHWARAWVDAYGARYDLDSSLLEHKPGEAILPLVRPRRRPWRLELLSARELAEPVDVVASDTTSVDSLASALAARGENVFLRRVPAGSALVPSLEHAYRRRGTVIVGATSPSPVLPIDETWAEPERHMGKRRRSDLRRARRRAEELGKVEYDLVAPTEAELDGYLDELVAVESHGWKGRASTALAHQAAQQQFFRSYARAAAREGELRLSFLRIDDQVAAAQLAVHRAAALWLLKIGYDEQFARCSPGTLLLLEAVATAALQGARNVEFLGMAKPWTARWTTSERSYVRVLAYARTPSAMPCLVEDTYRFVRHTVLERREAAKTAQYAGTAGEGE